VNEFVEECRREWNRLGVPEQIANEMAADLAADLEEAEAEGVPAEEVLGTGAFDPRAFAAAWAAERGVVGRRRNGLLRRSRVPAALGTFAVVMAIVGAALLILASPAGPGPRKGAVWVAVSSPPPRVAPVVISPEEVSLDVATGTSDSGDATRTIGSVLLIVGLAGVLPLTMFRLWAGPRSRLRL
jgi:hypothetical protein